MKPVLNTLELEQPKGLEKKERRKLINPNEFEQSVHYISFSPEQTLNMQVAGQALTSIEIRCQPALPQTNTLEWRAVV